jgi:hypothetical protein
MKLGSQTGSVTNHIYSRATRGQPDPVVGMGATVLCWTDRHAATIIDVQLTGKGTIVRVRRDKATRVDSNGFSESQQYLYEPQTSGPFETFLFDGSRWQELTMNERTGRLNKVKGGRGLRIGEREEYWDPCF